MLLKDRWHALEFLRGFKWVLRLFDQRDRVLESIKTISRGRTSHISIPSSPKFHNI